MTEPIAVIALDQNGVVLHARIVPPRRVLTVRGAGWMLETTTRALPTPAEQAVVWA
jgi:hypothetical protein